jgi:crotonobetainyl-CoA:carnitine CoA-transferase CaiB-like acyl-CoA transferase
MPHAPGRAIAKRRGESMDAPALQGLRVVDFTQGVAGPLAAMLLADLGADVIKIEPRRGDWIRSVGRKVEQDMSPTYVSVNRSKRAVCIELKEARGLEAARALVARADVLVESFRPGVMERFGLGYDALHAAQPGLIYASVTGYGRSGPYVNLPGADSVIQAMGGIMSLNGEGGGEPLRFGMFMVDMITGMTAYQGMLAALLAKARSGRGQRVDVSLLDAILAFQASPLSEYLMHGLLPERNGNVNSFVAPAGVVRTRDSFLMFTVLGHQWEKACAAFELGDLRHDPRYASNAGRLAHREELLGIVREKMLRHTTAEWLEKLRGHDILCAPIQDYGQLVADPQVLANRMLDTLRHPVLGALPLVRHPVRFSAMEPAYGPPPMLGEHTRQVLRDELGYAPADVEALLASGAAYAGPAGSGGADAA